MANTRGGYTRNSAPLWARGQDAFLVIRGSRDRSQLATCKVGLGKTLGKSQTYTVLHFKCLTTQQRPGKKDQIRIWGKNRIRQTKHILRSSNIDPPHWFIPRLWIQIILPRPEIDFSV